MTVPLIAPGPGANDKAVLKSLYDAVRALQNPGAPVKVASVALKTNLPPAADWPLCVIGCEEINSLVRSTFVTSAYVWLRADGSAL